MKIVLVGQPNCGKSALFNSVAGYKTIVSNFPGTTVDFITSRVNLNGASFTLVDLPGIYSLSTSETEELLARHYLIHEKPDLVINIMDASVLSRSLELTLELLELRVPLVVCLNMMDEAARKGVEIDVEHLSRDLGIPVVPTIATRGQGVPELFQTAIETAKRGKTGKIFFLSLDVERVVSELAGILGQGTAGKMKLPPRILAIKLLEKDEEFEKRVGEIQPGLISDIERLRRNLAECHGRPSDVVVSSERHSLAMNLFEHVAKVKARTGKSLRDQVDKYRMHPYLGYVFLAGILFTFFWLVFSVGKHVEEPLLALFETFAEYLPNHLSDESFFFNILNGLIQGFSGGIGIVLPYLIPFLLGLALLEDIGYLPRAAFLMDSIMHSIGLHGKSIIPFVLSYGCNVPAIMGVRIMERARDRFITSVLVTLIPCAARTTIIFALVAFYLGPIQALGLYVLNIVVIAGAGKILSHYMPDLSPGMILEMPSYKVPEWSTVVRKIWFRLREFIVIAWPLLIVGSVILSVLEFLHLSEPINGILSPFTSGLLGLPPEVGITLIFGILRKELTIIMLVQALGTSNFDAVMTAQQMMVFTVFSLFYIPCLATLGMLRSTIGNRGMLFTLFFNTAVGTLMALAFRGLYAVL
ncbi:MAG: ferrous iron transport protein B [Deltaproteobacteria bacterium]|nr:ferrous iron transport protein B [Deltaproteobacteria bacterium]